MKQDAPVSAASDGKAPRTARGERTLRKILDAARDEFERGFNDSSIVAITQRRRGLGCFYTYFDSKEAVFHALVRDMSAQVRDRVARPSRARPTRSTASAARSNPFSSSRGRIVTSTASSTRRSSSSAAYREHYETGFAHRLPSHRRPR